MSDVDLSEATVERLARLESRSYAANQRLDALEAVIAQMGPPFVEKPTPEAAQDQGEMVSGVGRRRTPQGAVSVQPSPAPSWPSEAAAERALTALCTLRATARPDGPTRQAADLGIAALAAYTKDAPAIEDAAFERGARELARRYDDEFNERLAEGLPAPVAVEVTDRFLAERRKDRTDAK
jgi:hypothetical protein